MEANRKPTGGADGAGDSRPADFAINARVRQVLSRRWVNLQGLEVGTTAGVVVLKGKLERELDGARGTMDREAYERFLWRLRSELKAIPGVSDVAMEVCDIERTGT